MPNYGHFLNRQEVANLTSNSQATLSVTKFLLSNGVEVVKSTPHGEYITARAQISQFEKMFATTFYSFRHNAGQQIERATHYSLPSELYEHVSAVFNTVQLPARTAPKKALRLAEAGKAGSVTPALLNSYYDITTNRGSSKASQSVFESLGQYYSPADLSLFETNYGLPQEVVAEDIGGYVSDSECVSDANTCIEANLDVQYMIAVSQVTPTTYWYSGAVDSFLAWIQDVAASENPPLVNSISYGAIESELPATIANAFNTEAMKLGLQGVSILVSSGDDGVANFQARSKPSSCGYNPSFPASSPYVTAVGATQGPESGTAEIACTSDAGGVITTGGGFSTLFDAPTYQKAAVAGYFAGLGSKETPVSGYVATGRGYPDIAMAGLNYEVVVGGKTYQVSGTSASSPVVAGMVSLVNAQRLEAGKGPLGFLNTAIYQNGATFANDVTSGENNCCASAVCCDEGFYASTGWDPLTGFGSVNYAKFAAIFANL
ncbi:peptidase S8/S53 domain-containing protein [Ochromonadaceae sp. CCMP2298]|nr:peptidase S8/S53 domain-containing protein [Ochromonadaceae sp. CCMP2298]|mmetsp:Transcript_6839/g.15014  ORF Transcript_6839/g.15014 Transcript_6839/m.15014 type:complete len:490 (+) Transcript_6839:309-1778(+)